MGRPEVAAACVRALAVQSRAPGLVVIALNDPGDGTLEEIAAIGDLPFALIFHPMARNRGNAGGVEEAMAVAMDHGAWAIWVLDDDSWPWPNALDVLADAIVAENTVAHPLQIDPQTNDIAWPVVVRVPGKEWRMIDCLDDLPDQGILESRPSWTGALLPRVAIEAAGPVLGELFIRGEDDEYSLRVADHGFKYVLVPAAVLDHPGPVGIIGINVMGKRYFWEPNLADWKMFYKVRNQVWLQRRRKGALSAGVIAIVAFGAMLRYDAISPGRVKVFVRALADGWAGRLGRAMVPPDSAHAIGHEDGPAGIP